MRRPGKGAGGKGAGGKGPGGKGPGGRGQRRDPGIGAPEPGPMPPPGQATPAKGAGKVRDKAPDEAGKRPRPDRPPPTDLPPLDPPPRRSPGPADPPRGKEARLPRRRPVLPADPLDRPPPSLPQDHPRLDDAPRPGAPRVPPQLLLPLRLEYRLVRRSKPPLVATRNPRVAQLQALRRDLAARRDRTDAKAEALRRTIAEEQRALAAEPASLAPARLQSEEELWLRWYPDDSFSETGLAPASPAEREALDRFLAHPLARLWPNLGQDIPQGDMAGLRALWAEFETLAGPARAVHLHRTKAEEPDPDWAARIGRIAGLPRRITLFAWVRGKLVTLGTGAAIPGAEDPDRRVSFNPDMLAQGNWLTDFDIALDRGMAIKITEPDLVKAARDADWIVATGSSADGAEALARLLADRTAAGGFALMQPDTATNDPGGSAAADALDRLALHAAREAGALQSPGRDGPRLAEALGQAAALFDNAPGAAVAVHEEAAAMIRLVGPALLDGAAAATPALAQIDDMDLIELLAEHVQAGGPYPSLRLGEGAYGILPLTTTEAETITPVTSDRTPAERAFESFVGSYARGIGRLLSTLSANVTPRIEPGDPDAPEKMLDILQSSRLSRRVDVSDEGSAEVAALGCPLVSGQAEADQPAAYLLALLRDDLGRLEPADETDRNTPLLARLALLSLRRIRVLEILKHGGRVGGRGSLDDISGDWQARLGPADARAVRQSLDLSLQSFGQARPEEVDRIPPALLPRLKEANARFEAAVRLLRAVPGGAARLETLLLGTLDLFQHRLDAWITGLASLRLQGLRRDSGGAGLGLGYYGFLGRLRDPAGDGAASSYLQAPSLAQARTAAVLRSAYLRGRAAGAFGIDLSAGRTRRALKILDLLRRGVGLPEALGLRGERWLRDQGQSDQIHLLREAFPIANPDADGSGTADRAGFRTFDGLALASAAPGGLPAAQRALHGILGNDLDALSDLVLSEAVHHRAGGSAETAAAWLRVLSGGPIPDRPEFIRAQRSGTASDYRVTLVLPPDPPPPVAPVTDLAEPGLAALMARRYGALATQPFTARILLGQEVLSTAKLTLSGALDLGAMAASRLGEAALRAALEQELASRLATRDDVRERGLVADVAGLRAAGAVIEVDLAPLQPMLAEAGDLWAQAQGAVALGPGELANAADPATPLTEAAHVAALAGASADLWARAERLGARLGGLHDALAQAGRAVFEAVDRHFVQPGLPWGARAPADAALSQAVRALHLALRPLSLLGLPEADALPAPQRLLEDTDGERTRIVRLTGALRARLRELRAALGARPAGPAPGLAEARADQAAAMAAIRQAMGAAHLALFPALPLAAPTLPLLAPPRPPAEALGHWPRYRRRLDRALRHLPPGWQAFDVLPAATADDADAPDRDRRPEEEAPRSHHFGVFLGAPADLAGPALRGIVLDEWGEVRPARDQQAALAINHDAPQAEAPNCLLLCVPQPGPARGWTDTEGALHVIEAIGLMQMRALTTQTQPLVDTLLPEANRVPPVRGRRRLPVARYPGGLRDWFAPMSEFVTLAEGRPDGQDWPGPTSPSPAAGPPEPGPPDTGPPDTGPKNRGRRRRRP